MLLLTGSQNTLRRRGEQLPTFSEIQPRSVFIWRVDSPRLRRAIDFLWEEICPKEWNLSRKAQSPHLQQLKRSIPLCEWMWYLEECQADSRGMWSHRAAVEPAALGEAYPAFCRLPRAEPSARREGWVVSVPALTPLGECWRRHSWEPLVSPGRRHLFPWHRSEPPICSSWANK